MLSKAWQGKGGCGGGVTVSGRVRGQGKQGGLGPGRCRK